MKIIVDAMGGDNAPLEILKGCSAAVVEHGIEIIAVGKKADIEKIMAENEISRQNITVVDAPDVITMDDNPLCVVKDKKESSLGVALELLKNGDGEALVSAGNTGALLAGGTLVIKRIKGIKRAALAPVMPTKQGLSMLIDSGATVDCKAEFLNQYGLMGSIYMKKMFGMMNPRVGLANNGTEDCKGTDLYIEAHVLLKANQHINFVGNVEGRGFMLGDCDVLVSDGFTGNLILKTCEGTALFFLDYIKGIFKKSLKSKIAAALIMDELKEFKKKADPSEIGGAALLGVTKPIVKAHGSSNAKAFKNAINQARTFALANIIEEITEKITQE